MERFKLMTNEEYFTFVNNSTFISNLNQGQIMVPGLQNMQQKFNPMENVSSINNNQQSNYSSFGKGYGNAK
tara:strand:+ start:383 stop:595 length:213 start_codon:yes stop_codon:yes gene_type:complete